MPAHQLLRVVKGLPWDMASGRDYVRRGDPFTLAVERGEGPPTVTRWVNQGTGRHYFTRVPVHRCERLDALKVVEAAREYAGQLSGQRDEPVDVRQLAQRLAFDWQPVAGQVVMRLRTQPVEGEGTVRVTLQATGTGQGGVRYWLTCPRCARRCGVLYASRWDGQGMRLSSGRLTGCRTCLGLTDASRQRHKCLDWCGAVSGARPYREGRRGVYRWHGSTQVRAAGVMRRACRGLF